MTKTCKDCPPGSTRSARFPGPRCWSHDKAVNQARSDAAHERMVMAIYGLPPGGYAKLLAAQGGVCFICRRANGKTKRLAVDHRHSDNVVRGILCGPCNQLLGHARDDPDMLIRAAQYLINPPAERFLT